nr:phenoloxidase-activating factor 2-like isoform X4 [Procambarus clarkii]
MSIFHPGLEMASMLTVRMLGSVMVLMAGVEAQADGSFWWLQKFTTPTPPTTTTLHEAVYCECVKYFLCIDGVISTSGEGLLDIRSSDEFPPVTNVDKCPNDFDVCCGLPPNQTATTATTSQPTLAPDTPCECVPFINCTNDRLVSDGLGNTTLELWGLHFSHSKCLQVLSVCCALDAATAGPTPQTSSLATKNCECVQYFQCDDDGYIITHGVGLLDVRSGTRPHIEPLANGVCEDPSLVCCLLPQDYSTTVNATTTINTTTADATATTTLPTTTTTQEPAPSCGTRNSDGVQVRILGFQGGESQFGEFPWVAAMLTLDQLMGITIRRFVGGGTLIHPRVVVTAAHKVLGYNGGILMVRVGEWDTQAEIEPFPHQDLEVQEVVVHPHFDSRSLHYDIALLFLKEEAQLMSHIGTICLAEDLSLVNHSACVINGWGVNALQDGDYQKIMKSLTIPLVNPKNCVTSLRTTRLGRFFRLHKSFICAGGEKGKDACRGDGGGPLACPRIDNPKRYMLVGMTAWGIGCGEDGIPGVYVSIPEHYNWINWHIYNRYPTTTTSTTTERPSTPHYLQDLKDDPMGYNTNAKDNNCEINLLTYILKKYQNGNVIKEWSESTEQSDVKQTGREQYFEEQAQEHRVHRHRENKKGFSTSGKAARGKK